MAEINIRLIYNLETGKKDIFVDYESDQDALPIEHEQGHREIVGQLLGQGILAAEEMGEVTVQRVRPGTVDQQEQTRQELPPEAQQEGAAS